MCMRSAVSGAADLLNQRDFHRWNSVGPSPTLLLTDISVFQPRAAAALEKCLEFPFSVLVKVSGLGYE